MAAVILKYKIDNGDQYRVRGIKYSGDGKVYTIGFKDDYMYISVPEGTVDSYIPQPAEVDIDVVTMTPAVSADLCSWGIPFRRIDKKTRRTIREKYSIEDEFKALRTNDLEYTEFVETLITDGKRKKLEILGLADTSEDSS
jgi:hypothetical protein